MWLIWLRFMWKFISSVESMVVLSLVIFEKMSSNQVSKYRFWQEKYHYLSTLNLLQNRNPNTSLPIHSFLLNLKQFYRLYLWSLFVFLFVWVFWEEERMLVVFFSCLFGLSWVVFFFFFHLLTEVHLRLFLASLLWVMKQHVLAPVSLTSNLLIPGCHPCAAPGYASDNNLAGLLGSRVLQTMEKRGTWRSCTGI